jgi:hypothetical protein
MDFLSGANALDPLKALQYRAFMSARTRSRQARAATGPKFWSDPKFGAWESAASPTLIMVKGDYSNRFQVQSFAVDVIHDLRSQNVPIIWALKSVSAQGVSAASTVDIIKGLICQAIQLNMSQQTERSLALSCAQFRAADSPEQWFNLLAQTIASFPQLYIVVDLEAVGSSYLQGISWLSEMTAMFQRHASGKWISRLKILLISYGSMTWQQPDMVQFRDVVVSVGQSQFQSVSRGRMSTIGTHGRTMWCGRRRPRPVRGSMRTGFSSGRGFHAVVLGN